MTKKALKPTKPTKPAKRANAAKPVAPAKKSTPPKPPAKVYILFGADEYAKPRAARFSAFSAEDTALLAKAAASLHVRLVEGHHPRPGRSCAQAPGWSPARQRQRTGAVHQG